VVKPRRPNWANLAQFGLRS